jgi:hypothetical protein
MERLGSRDTDGKTEGLGGDSNIVIVTPVLLPGQNPSRLDPKFGYLS